MKSSKSPRVPKPTLAGAVVLTMAAAIFGIAASPCVGGDHGWWWPFSDHFGHKDIPPGQIDTMNGGAWFWSRSPEQEKVVVMSLFNRYCIRCHGVDGRGVWDIPGIPDFTNVRWQSYRTDAQIARIIIEGRGAVMPQFRGALSLEEAWGIAHYLRTFVPGTELSKPDLGSAVTPPAPRAGTGSPPPRPATTSPPPPAASPPAPASAPGPFIPRPTSFRGTTSPANRS
jgi:hypothetical protein